MLSQISKDWFSAPQYHGVDIATIYGYTMLGCAAVFVLGHIISSVFVKTYRNLHNKDKIRWDLAIVRSVFAFVSAYMSIHTLLGEPELFAEPTTKNNAFSALVFCYTSSFFVWETITLLYLYVFHAVREAPLMLHHILGLIYYSGGLVSGKMHFFGCFALIEEFSAPFTAFGWMLQKAGLEPSILYIYNQVALLLVWVFLRIGCDAIIEFRIWNVRYEMLAAFHPSNGFLGVLTATFMMVGNLILVFYLNPYWFYKKFQQLTRAMRERNARMSAKTQHHGKKHH
jgi:hypothetical protein